MWQIGRIGSSDTSFERRRIASNEWQSYRAMTFIYKMVCRKVTVVNDLLTAGRVFDLEVTLFFEISAICSVVACLQYSAEQL